MKSNNTSRSKTQVTSFSPTYEYVHIQALKSTQYVTLYVYAATQQRETRWKIVIIPTSMYRKIKGLETSNRYVVCVQYSEKNNQRTNIKLYENQRGLIDIDVEVIGPTLLAGTCKYMI